MPILTHEHGTQLVLKYITMAVMICITNHPSRSFQGVSLVPVRMSILDYWVVTDSQSCHNSIVSKIKRHTNWWCVFLMRSDCQHSNSVICFLISAVWLSSIEIDFIVYISCLYLVYIPVMFLKWIFRRETSIYLMGVIWSQGDIKEAVQIFIYKQVLLIAREFN